MGSYLIVPCLKSVRRENCYHNVLMNRTTMACMRKIDYVYRSIFAQDVDKMESVLIDNYIGNSKCKNRRDGDLSYKDDMADDALVYQVYIVWNEEEQ